MADELSTSTTTHLASTESASSIPATRKISIIWLTVVLAAFLCVGIATGSSLFLIHLRNQIYAENERALSNTTLILAKKIEVAFAAIENVQRIIVDQTAAFGINDAAEREYHLSQHGIHLKLRDHVSGLYYVGSLTLINAEGRLINFSRQWPIPQLSAADRDFFRALQSDSDLTSFIGAPARNRANGSWIVQFARKIIGPNKEFFGLTTAAVELDLLQKSLEEITLDPESGVAIFRDDGVLIARIPKIESEIGRHFPNAFSLKLVSTSEKGVGLGQAAVVGDTRMIAAHRVKGYPIIVSAAKSVAAISANWRRTAEYVIAMSALSIVAILAFAFVLVRTIKSYKLRTELRAKQEKEKFLIEQNSRFGEAVSNMSLGLVMFDAAGRIVVCNRQYLEMYRLSDEVVKPGLTLLELLKYRAETGTFDGDPHKYSLEIADKVAAGMLTGQTLETADGRAIRVINQPMQDGRWLTTHEDVTDKVRAEEQLRQTREFLHAIVESVPTPIVVKNADTLQYLLINRAGEEYFGLPRAEMIGKTSDEVLEESAAAVVNGLDRRTLDTRQQITDEHTLTTPGAGVKQAATKRVPILNDSGAVKYLLEVIEDVTQRRAVEQQLQHAQKMEAVGNLSGGIAHDFNNLLTVIVGNLDLLQDHVAGNAAAEQKLRAILESSLHGATLTRQLLAFSRRQPLRTDCVELTEAISRIAQLMMRTLGENVIVENNTAADCWPVQTDAHQLEAAIINIAINARDAMPSGGKLSIATKNIQLEPAQSASLELPQGDYVAIEIKDNGNGMPQEVLQRVFEPFFTTKQPGKGTGLGLSMVYGFVKQSGGNVTVSSKLGLGTCFTLYFPRAMVAAERLSTVRGNAEAKSGSYRGVILVVDDNPQVQATAVLQLQQLGYSVIKADSAAAALEILDSSGPIDLLFTDIVMPGDLNGRQLAAEALKRRPNLRVLFTSGFPGVIENTVGALDTDFALLAKPYRRADLERAISEALGHHELRVA